MDDLFLKYDEAEESFFHPTYSNARINPGIFFNFEP